MFAPLFQRSSARWLCLPLVVMTAFILTFSGCSHAQPEQKMRIYLESPDDGARFNRPARSIVMPLTENHYYVYESPIIPEGDIVNVELVQVDLGYCIRLDLSRHASVIMHSATASNQGGRLFLLVNDKPVGVRLIDSPIADGQVYMFLEIPDKDLPQFVLDAQESCKRVQKILKSEGY